ncbi:hypothetical protein VTO42DRAFT_6617 [Malbranchea cinnamomea]
MPSYRRALQEEMEMANRSASSDDDYDDRQTRSRKSKPKARKGVPKKRKRASAHDSESDDLSISDNSVSELAQSEDDPNVERNARGLARRNAAKQARYKEPSTSEEEGGEGDEEQHSDNGDGEDEGEDASSSKGKPRKRLLVRLSLKPRQTSAPPTRRTRSTRGRSNSFKESELPHMTRYSTRKSARLMHDESDDIVALSGSGRHVETIRRGTRSPEATNRTRATSAVRVTVKDTIPEEEEMEEEGNKAETNVHPVQPAVEVLESDPLAEPEDEVAAPADAAKDTADAVMVEPGVVPESEQGDIEEDEETPRSRVRTRSSRKEDETAPTEEQQEDNTAPRRSSRRLAAKSRRQKQDEGSDFEPNSDDANDDDDTSDSEASQVSPRKRNQNSEEAEESSNGRRSRLRKRQSQSRAESEADELVEELAELKASCSRRRERAAIVYEDKPRRTRKSVDYRIFRPELALPLEEEDDVVEPSPRRSRTGGGSGWQRSLFSTYGPFGGGGGPPALLGGPAGVEAIGGVESDSSDEESGQRPKVADVSGVTASTAVAQGLNLGAPQTHNDSIQTNLGKIKDRQALADADPLGIDSNVTFDSVGGLQGHIDQLKEMVSLPLLYPEIFQRFKIVPPRGVLFHGPPGTGKTLLARALASSVSSGGRKVTFYMRKGADALSKWVGEAERQLRLLFEEARKNQPSIIFFDEIDGLAPVRSSKQEQIHASIVSTLLALMDGMDGRGQVIVIGATNRPDSIDPALRRPGRFDREFYFPLPNTEARRAIIDIHTRGWDPPLSNEMKDELAQLTKGYGGADLRALCTEAALNAVQRRYPQIYRSNEKLSIDPKKIEVTPKDFMISLKKIVPSSQRAASSAAAPLPPTVEPLLRDTLRAIKDVISEMIPLRKRLTALEEAQFEEPDDQIGFRRERMQHAFETSRVFRPRLLIRGKSGMGQQYLAAALLNHFEGLHVQPFDLPTLLSDSTRSPEASVVQLFTEVKRHKPSVIYIPDVRTWYETVGQTVLSTFLGLLRSLPPTDPVLLFGVTEIVDEDDDSEVVKTLFGYSKKNCFKLEPPGSDMRREFFQPLIDYIKTAPSDFPDPTNRKKRQLEPLEPVPAPTAPQPPPFSKEELKAQRKKDRLTLNLLKIRIQPIMNEIKKYKRFRTGVIDESQIRYLFEEEDPNIVTTDLPLEQRTAFRPFEKAVDKHGVPGLREAVSGKFYYNMDIVTIEKRLSNGYYKRPKDFLADIKRIAQDARQLGEPDRLLKANELLANVEVDIAFLEQSDANLVQECENVYVRELERERLALEKAKGAAGAEGAGAPPSTMNVAHGAADSANQSSGPVVLGEPFGNIQPVVAQQPLTPTKPTRRGSQLNGNVNFHQFGNALQQSGFRLSTSNESNSITRGGTDHDGDVQMSNSENTSGVDNTNTQDSSFGPSAQPRPPHSYTAPSQQLRQQSGLSNLSQKGTMTPMAPGSQPGDYANDASTTQTTSDKKHSGPSDHSHINSQAYIGLSSRHEGPDLNLYPDRASGDEHLPDTQQGDSSWGTPLTGILEYAHSQPNGSQVPTRPSQSRPQPPVPPFDASPRQPRADNESSNDNQNPPHPDLIVDEEHIGKLHSQLTSRTSGCSVEQLEQINASLMDCIWKTRDQWNRMAVVKAVQDTFNDVLADMAELQGIAPPSQRTKFEFTHAKV